MMAQVTESDYRTAQDGNAKVRQEFIEAVDLEDAREFIDEVVYEVYDLEKGKFDYILNPTLMSCRTKNLFFENISLSSISVYSSSFSFFSYREFLSAFLDHEGQHARQIKKNPVGWNWNVNNKSRTLKSPFKNEYFTELFELPAIANQLAKSAKRNLTPEEHDRRVKQFALSERSLEYTREHFVFPRNLKKDLQKILCNSDGDNLVRQHLGIK